MSRNHQVAGFQVIMSGRLWVITEELRPPALPGITYKERNKSDVLVERVGFEPKRANENT